jgi:subtilisin family serine protease
MKFRLLLVLSGLVICFAAWPQKSVPTVAGPAVVPPPAAEATAPEPRISPAPEAIPLGDSYPVMGVRRTFLRRAGEVAVKLHEGGGIDDLIAPGAPFARFAVLQTWPQGVTMLRAPADEVARQIADPARSKVWLGELQDSRAAAMANPVLVDPESGLFLVPFGEIVVRLKEGIDPAAHFAADFSRASLLPGTTDQWLLALSESDFDTTMSAILRHSGSPAVEWAEINFINESRPAFIPNDPRYPDQWHLGGDSSGAIGYNRADISAETAWNTTRGDEDIVVAVIDDAIDMVHEDLVPNLFINANEIAGNGIDEDSNGFIDDRNGWNFFLNNNNPAPTGAGSAFGVGQVEHGTAVAGVAVARGHNGIGVSGAAPNCRLLPVNHSNTSAGQANQLRYVAGLTGNGWRGADVVNMSYRTSRDAAKDAAFADAARRGRQGRGCVLIAAAGNGAGAWFYIQVTLAAGTHNFEWRYTKNGSVDSGQDAVWLDDVGFYDPLGTFTVAEYGFNGFGSGAPGFTSGGAANWTFYTGSDRATGILDSSSLRSGVIGAGQTSSLYFTKELFFPTEMRFKVWVDSQRNADTLQFFKDGTALATISGPVLTGLSPFASHDTSGSATITAINSPFAVDPFYPANHPDVFCVGASTDYDLRSNYSQYGSKLDVVAPSDGGDLGIVTTDITGAGGYNPAGNYVSFRTQDGFGGTSSASPLVSGVAALVLSADPWLTRKQVTAILRDTADQVGGVTYGGDGKNLYYGHGRVNAASAVNAALIPSGIGYSQNFNAIPDNSVEFNDGSSFYSNVQLQTPGNVAGWQTWSNFFSRAADTGTSLNTGVSILSTEGGTAAVVISDGGDGAGQRAFATGWENGANTKSWLIPVNTKDTAALNFTCRLMGTNNFVNFLGPRDFKLQYRIGVGPWADVAGGAIQAGSNTFNTLNVALPPECEDQPALQLRLVMTSNTSVTGAAVTGGQSHLDDVLVTGAPHHSTASVQGGALRMTKDGVNNALSHYVLPQLDFPILSGFEASFRYKLNGSNAADGFSFNFGDLDEGTNGGEQGFGQGLSVSFVTYFFAGRRHELRVDGTPVTGGLSQVSPFIDNAWHRVKIRWRKTAGTGINGPVQGFFTLIVDDVALLRDVPTSFDPEGFHRMSFAARTGGASEDLWLDDVSVQPLGPDHYARNYDGYPLDSTFLSDGTTTTSTANNGVGVGVAGGRVGFRLNEDGVGFNVTSHVLPDLGAGPRQGFEATFKYYMAATGIPADGFAFNLGNPASNNGGEEGFADGLAVGFNLYSYNGHKVLVDGVAGSLNPQDPFVNGQWHDVVIRWERLATSNGELTLKVDGQVIFDKVPTSGFNPAATDRFAFTSRTGFYMADILIDDVSVRPLFSLPLDPGPLLIRRLPNVDPDLGVFSLRWGSVAGRNHRMDSSVDLNDWSPVLNRAGVDGFDFVTIILSLEDDPKTFYRVVREP